MLTETSFLLYTAASLGVIHTVVGPDHYIPFAALSAERKWSMSKTMGVTFLCGLGHILSSVLLGWGGIALGTTVGKLTAAEALRGNLTGWALMAFGLLYALWGLKKACGHEQRADWTTAAPRKSSARLWIFFIIFVFGPCEPLIPVLMYPAAHAGAGMLWAVTALFGATTLAAMLALVFATAKGLAFLPLGKAVRYVPALTGLGLLGCGAGVAFLGL